MLRVDASNLPAPRSIPRPRRILPAAPQILRRGSLLSAPRHELPPPAPKKQLEAPRAAPPPPVGERWSVRLELGDGEIAKLYGQGMARGAVVWRKGMAEWRPLLITPELTGLLRRTRISLDEPPAPTEAAEPVTAPRLPAPARLPSDLDFGVDESGRRAPLTVSPTAVDVPAPLAAPSRRGYEVGAALVVGFALAWLGQASLTPDARSATSEAIASLPPTPLEPTRASVAAAGPPPVSSIPLVALSELPVLGSSGRAAPASHSVARARSAGARGSGAGSNRAELVAALSRVASAASGCGEREGPVRVVITFANSGVARSIQVSGQGLPASTRSCIIGAASRARVPSFSGDTVTVSKTL